MLTLPGLVDIGSWVSGEQWQFDSRAAIAGGFTALVAGAEQTSTLEDLSINLQNAAEYAVCDYGQLIAVTGENARYTDEFLQNATSIMLDFDTTAGLTDPMLVLTAAFRSWNSDRPVCIKGNAEQIGAAIFGAKIHNRAVHIRNVCCQDQLEMILEGKQNGVRVSCDVALHTLFISQKHFAGMPEDVRALLPEPGEEKDREFIWRNLDSIDCFSTGHMQSGYPALETAVPLLVYLIQGGFLTSDDVRRRFSTNPSRIFKLVEQQDTLIEIDEAVSRVIDPAVFQSVLKVSPFRGMKLPGIVKQVRLRGEVVFDNGEVLASSGSGQALEVIREELPS